MPRKTLPPLQRCAGARDETRRRLCARRRVWRVKRRARPRVPIFWSRELRHRAQACGQRNETWQVFVGRPRARVSVAPRDAAARRRCARCFRRRLAARAASAGRAGQSSASSARLCLPPPPPLPLGAIFATGLSSSSSSGSFSSDGSSSGRGRSEQRQQSAALRALSLLLSFCSATL